MKKGFSNMSVVAALLIVFLGLAGYFFLQGNSTPTSTQNTSPTPQTNQPSKQEISSLFQKTSGCGNIYVYQTGNNGEMGISVHADKDSLDLSTTARIFNIESVNSNDLRIELRIGENVGYLYCNDALDPNQPPYKTFRGTEGEVTISISKIDESQPVWNKDYTATVVLRNVHFIDENNNDSDMFINELIFSDVRVGWLPG